MPRYQLALVSSIAIVIGVILIFMEMSWWTLSLGWLMVGFGFDYFFGSLRQDFLEAFPNYSAAAGVMMAILYPMSVYFLHPMHDPRMLLLYLIALCIFVFGSTWLEERLRSSSFLRIPLKTTPFS